MWHLIKKVEQNYFFKCKVEEDTIKYYLYNLKEVWSESCSISEIIQRAKNSNRRIFYDNATVIKTLQSATPTTVDLEASEHGRDVSLKYHINGRPFNFEWNLKTISADEFQNIIMNPLFMSIHYLAEQIKELKKTVIKKDIEIKQYKEEGAVLSRKTVATEEFDESAFDDRYSHVNEISKEFVEISERIKEQVPLPNPKVISDNCNKEQTKRPSTFNAQEKNKKSPNKKRKFLENRRQQMLSMVKSKQNDGMEYESQSSQSQSMSQSPPHMASPTRVSSPPPSSSSLPLTPPPMTSPAPQDELAEIYKSLNELNARRLELFPE